MAPRRITADSTTTYPLKIFRGITYSRTYILKTSEGPVDLTGKAIAIHLKYVLPELTVIRSGDPATDLGSEVVITDAVNGKFRFKLTDEETLTATLGCGGKWWMILEDAGDEILLWKDGVDVEDI